MLIAASIMHEMIKPTVFLIGLLLSHTAIATGAGDRASATYLANAGVMVKHGDAKVLIDPLYRLNHSYYRSVPEDMENNLLVGEPPFDGVDAVLVTHIHLDHFSPNLLLNYLMINTGARLYAPEQAVIALRRYTTDEDAELLDRIVSLNLSQYGQPVRHQLEGIEIETVRIPHAGWPDSNRSTQNLAFRVTLAGEATVMHLGDSAPQSDLFSRFGDHWAERDLDMLFAPYWFFLEGDGLRIISSQLKPAETTGVHVPSEVPAEPNRRDSELQDLNLFVRPGEIRSIGNPGL